MRTFMKLIGAKYTVCGKYFWRLKNAMAYGEANAPAIVFTIDWGKVRHFKSHSYSCVHPDANNFNPYQ